MITALVLLAVAALVAPFAPRLGRAGGALLALAPAWGFGYFLTQLGADPAEVRLPWIPTLGVELAFRLDGLSLLFALLVTGIGVLVLIYAGSYLHGHRDLGRFYPTMLVFMGSMLGLVLADDALLMFAFWEGTSLSSYLLIGFDHETPSARVAARKALVVTGTGGLALLGGLILLHDMTGTWALSEWTAQPELILDDPRAPLALVLVLLGAFTKSAQVPFHFWLPAAMAGPTPVSAYLHSATMVKAGVFLLARLSPIWSDTEAWTAVLVSFGAATMVLSAWAALRFGDLKQVLAHTTTMALGLLVMLLGFGDAASVEAAMSYLVVHALYKGSLFMMAGSVDHGTHTRELDDLSGLGRAMPGTALAAFLACASMAGLPPFIGFVGKEAMYQANLDAGGLGGVALAAGFLANVALFATAAVLALRPFLGRPSKAAEHAHEGDAYLLVGPLALAGLGLFLGLDPGRLDGVVGAAASAVTGQPVTPHLALWHGLGPALGASALTYLTGAALFLGAARLRGSSVYGKLVDVFAEGPSRGFEALLVGTREVAAVITGAVYSGKLRYYALSILGVLLTVGLVVTLRTGGLAFPAIGPVRPHELVLAVVLVVSSGVATFVEPAMRAIIAVGISGFCVALVYLI